MENCVFGLDSGPLLLPVEVTAIGTAVLLFNNIFLMVAEVSADIITLESVGSTSKPHGLILLPVVPAVPVPKTVET